MLDRLRAKRRIDETWLLRNGAGWDAASVPSAAMAASLLGTGAAEPNPRAARCDCHRAEAATGGVLTPPARGRRAQRSRRMPRSATAADGVDLALDPADRLVDALAALGDARDQLGVEAL